LPFTIAYEWSFIPFSLKPFDLSRSAKLCGEITPILHTMMLSEFRKWQNGIEILAKSLLLEMKINGSI
jgi:hypothetical protein